MTLNYYFYLSHILFSMLLQPLCTKNMWLCCSCSVQQCWWVTKFKVIFAVPGRQSITSPFNNRLLSILCKFINDKLLLEFRKLIFQWLSATRVQNAFFRIDKVKYLVLNDCLRVFWIHAVVSRGYKLWNFPTILYVMFSYSVSCVARVENFWSFCKGKDLWLIGQWVLASCSQHGPNGFGAMTNRQKK